MYEVEEWSPATPFKWTRENALWCKPLDVLALEDRLLALEVKGKATNREAGIISRMRELYIWLNPPFIFC